MLVREIKLGQRVKDKVTGFQGIAVYHTHFINGCHQIGVQSQKLDKDGEMVDSAVFDIQQLDVTGVGVNKKIKPKSTGGPVGFKVQYGK